MFIIIIIIIIIIITYTKLSLLGWNIAVAVICLVLDELFELSLPVSQSLFSVQLKPMLLHLSRSLMRPCASEPAMCHVVLALFFTHFPGGPDSAEHCSPRGP